jgi:phage replication initiation protein
VADGTSPAGLPSSNRGVSQFSNPTWTGIDWCAFTAELDLLLAETGHDGSACADLLAFAEIPEYALDLAAIAHGFYLAGSGVVLLPEAGKGKFYKNRFALNTPDGQYCGLIEVGGDHTRRKGEGDDPGPLTIRVELTGEGCTAYEGRCAGADHAERWLALRAKLESTAGRLTRVDVAHDDFKGDHTVKDCLRMYAEGAFDKRGQHPKAQHLDDLGSRAGQTVYVGTRASEHYLCVYDKGQQLGDVESPWVRWEVRFSASSRKEIALDILRDPVSYFRGAYPVLDFIAGCLLRFVSLGENRAACMKSLFRHVKRQYGKAFNFLQHFFKDDEALGAYVVTLSRPGLPVWAYGYLAAETGPLPEV